MRARVVGSLLVLLVSSVAFAQGGMGPMGSAPPAPQPVNLTTKDVERLLKVLPEVAREGAKFNARSGGAPTDPALAQAPEMKKIEGLLSKEGLTMMDFAMQMATLVSTYLALSPDAFEQQLPSENSPDMKKVLTDPKVPTEQKDALRQQIKFAQENKEALRAQLTQLATEENKKVVKPFLPRVKKALDEAQAEAKKGQAPGTK